MGARSPVATCSEMLYADATLAAGARLAYPADHEERAIYVVKGVIELGNRSFGTSQLLVLKRGGESAGVAPPGARPRAPGGAPPGARLLLLGGEPLDGVRHIWWNFVSSSQPRIEQARADWKAGRFPGVPGETEFIPLPE